MEDPQIPPSTFAPASHSSLPVDHHPRHYDDLYDNQHNHNYYYNYNHYPHHYQPHSRSPEYPPHPEDQDYRHSQRESYYQHNHHQHQRSQSQLAAAPRGHDSVISHPFSPKGSSPPSPGSSISSGQRRKRGGEGAIEGPGSGSGSRSTPEIQPAQVSQPQPQGPINVSYPPQAHTDPEKAVASTQRTPRSHNTHSSNPEVTAILYESAEYKEKAPEEKAVQLLLFLSGPCAFLSLLITLWTLLSLFIVLLLQPFRLFTTRPPLSAHLTTFLAPPLNLQLHLVYSHNSATDYSPALLLVIHLFSPIVAMGVAVAAWTAAFFWFFSAILGDPAGQDGHNDGRDSIMGVRNWWDGWLCRALR